MRLGLLIAMATSALIAAAPACATFTQVQYGEAAPAVSAIGSANLFVLGNASAQPEIDGKVRAGGSLAASTDAGFGMLSQILDSRTADSSFVVPDRDGVHFPTGSKANLGAATIGAGQLPVTNVGGTIQFSGFDGSILASDAPVGTNGQLNGNDISSVFRGNGDVHLGSVDRSADAALPADDSSSRPGGWLMMVFGLGGLGLMIRRDSYQGYRVFTDPSAKQLGPSAKPVRAGPELKLRAQRRPVSGPQLWNARPA